jgi:hypothetical protein
MQKTIYIFAILFFIENNAAVAGSIASYVDRYRQHGMSEYEVEMRLLSGYDFEKIVTDLNTFYSDTLSAVREKAYYFTYKKGLQGNSTHRRTAVNILVSGLSSAGGSTAGQLLGHLQAFAPVDFDEKSKVAIVSLLFNRTRPHYGDLALLAGYISAGKEELLLQFANATLKVKDKWNVALALARMDNPDALAYCIKRVKTVPMSGDVVAYLLPGLIYTRRKEAIDYCVALLYSDAKLCYSLNPTALEKVSCAYQIIAKLAPVIVDFPLKVDALGDLKSDDYGKALQAARSWFTKNADYKIITDTF